jgi:hypothetical protein
VPIAAQNWRSSYIKSVAKSNKKLLLNHSSQSEQSSFKITCYFNILKINLS